MANVRKARIAQNENAFRALNESLGASVHRGRPANELAGFVCECGNPDCDDTVRVPLPTYQSVRADAQLFILKPGHDIPDTEDVVAAREGFNVVRKHEDVADIVARGHTR
jgi:glycerate-2-kinase